MDVIKIGLWGAQGVGKTSFLASLLFHTDSSFYGLFEDSSERPEEKERGHFKLGDLEKIGLAYTRHTVPGGTTKLQELRLKVRENRRDQLPESLHSFRKEVLFMDVKGGSVVSQLTDDYREMLDECDFLLCMLEWGTKRLAEQMGPFEQAIQHFDGRKILMFTKCERFLSCDDTAWQHTNNSWFKDKNWGQQGQLDVRNRNLLGRCERAYATSAVGYNEEGRTQLLLGDMPSDLGDFSIRYGMQPKGASEALIYILEQANVTVSV